MSPESNILPKILQKPGYLDIFNIFSILMEKTAILKGRYFNHIILDIKYL